MKKIKRALDESGIEVPFPYMKLIMTADGDQAQRFKFEDDEQKNLNIKKHLKI